MMCTFSLIQMRQSTVMILAFTSQTRSTLKICTSCQMFKKILFFSINPESVQYINSHHNVKQDHRFHRGTFNQPFNRYKTAKHQIIIVNGKNKDKSFHKCLFEGNRKTGFTFSNTRSNLVYLFR